jgi:hypothetical protein
LCQTVILCYCCLTWKVSKLGSIFEFDNWVLTWNPP